MELQDGVDLVQDLLCALVLGLPLAQAAGVTTIIMLTKMIASQAQPPSEGIHTPKTMMTEIHYHRPDKNDTNFATFSTPKAKKTHTQKQENALAEKLSVPLYVFVPDREPDLLTDSHVKVDILVVS